MRPFLPWFGFLFLVACGPDSDRSPGERDVPLELVSPKASVVAADEGTFEVTWRPEVTLAAEADVFADLEDLNAQDGLYRVKTGSSLLEGLAVGSLVVWPQVGMFKVVALTDGQPWSQVRVEWAPLKDVVSKADISFRHELRAGESGRVWGVAPGDEPTAPEEGTLRQGLGFEKGPLKFTKDGVEYTNKDTGSTTALKTEGRDVKLTHSITTKALDASLSATAKDIILEGRLQYDSAKDDEPGVRISFTNVTIEGESKLQVKGVKGSIKFAPKVALTFPFAIGPVPMYASLSTAIEIDSTVATKDAVFTATGGFSMVGDLSMAASLGEGADVTGTLRSFTPKETTLKYETTFTTGIRIAVDVPKLSFGLGRPSILSGSIFGTHAVELVANVELDPFNRDRGECTTVNANAAIFAGGELDVLGFKKSQKTTLVVKKGPEKKRGSFCGK